MIEFINKVAKDLKEDLWLMKSMVFSEIFERLPEEDQYDRIYQIGFRNLILYRVEKTRSDVERIKKYCKSELNGTFYDDFEKQWEGTDIESEYTQDTPYKYILGIWENLPTPYLTENVKDMIDKHEMLGSSLMEGFVSHFGAKLASVDEDGEMKETSVFDMKVADSLRTGLLISNVDEFNERLVKIKFIAEKRGSFEEILKLIEK